ncbi:hypothetical protein MRX96_044708 [Rhipicephalus microplus]
MSSPRISSTSVKKGTCATAANEVAARAATSAIPQGSLKISCWLLVLTVMTVAVYMILIPSSRRQDSPVGTLIDVDDDEVGRDRASVNLRPPVQTPVPAIRGRLASSKHISTTEAMEAESDSDASGADNTTEMMNAPQIVVRNESRGPCTEQAQFGVCTYENNHEFFFDIEKQECRSKARQLPPSCLAGQNRFKSFRDCRLACMDQVPEQRCQVEPRYRSCAPEDIVRQWWYLKRGRCHLWKFPNSNCVSPRLALFEREEDCHNLCVAGKPIARHPSCTETPRAARVHGAPYGLPGSGQATPEKTHLRPDRPFGTEVPDGI